MTDPDATLTKEVFAETRGDILRRRARELARPPAAQTPGGDVLDVLEFRLAQERYAVETAYVHEVYPLRDLMPLPGAPAFIVGIVSARSQVLPVYDLKKFFDLPEQGLTDLHRVIVVRHADLELGLLADISVGVRSVARTALQSGLPTLTGIRAEYLKGVTVDGLTVLDLERLLTDPRIIVNHDES